MNPSIFSFCFKDLRFELYLQQSLQFQSYHHKNSKQWSFKKFEIPFKIKKRKALVKMKLSLELKN